MIKVMVTRESQITTQIVLNNQPNSNTTEMKQGTKTWKIHKTEATICGLYITIPVMFEQSERSNWSTTKYEPADKFSVRSNGGRNNNRNPKSFVLNRNAENAAAVWDAFLSAQTTSQDPNGQIEVTQSINLLAKFQPDPTVNKASVGVGSC